MIVFITIILWQQKRIDTLKQNNYCLKDTLQVLNFQRISEDDKQAVNKKFLKLCNEQEVLNLDKNVLEAHRISTFNGTKNRIYKVELMQDSVVKLSYKEVGLRNPFTGEGKDSIYQNRLTIIDKSIWYAFKAKLNSLDLYSLTGWGYYMDCFGGDTLWEAKISGKSFVFNSQCGQHPEFDALCQIIINEAKYD